MTTDNLVLVDILMSRYGDLSVDTVIYPGQDHLRSTMSQYIVDKHHCSLRRLTGIEGDRDGRTRVLRRPQLVLIYVQLTR
jgi:hypothetical protein